MAAPSRISLAAADGVRLSGLYWDPGVRDAACVVAHGFTGAAGKPHVRAICALLRDRGFGVLAPDLRGHGRSGGECTAGADERHDVAGAVSWLRGGGGTPADGGVAGGGGYARVAVLGWSMGGSAVLRYAGLGGAADAVVAVSSPGTWFERGTRPMRFVHWMCESRTGRATARLARHTRIARAGWAAQPPEAPAEVVGAIAPTPLLLVHGDADRYFPLAHVQALAAAAPSAQVWIEPGLGHAETAMTPALLGRIADWVAQCLAPAPGSVCDDDRRD